MKNNKSLAEVLRRDKELAPYFIDYIAENLKMTMSVFYKLDSPSKLKFRNQASKSLLALVGKLDGKVDDNKIYIAIEETCRYYLQFVDVFGAGIFRPTNDENPLQGE